MARTARVSFPAMTALLRRMPRYASYRTEAEAAAAERIFRRALGAVLTDCRNHLQSVLERRPQTLNSEQEYLIEELVASIGRIFRRLDREGAVVLVGDCLATIAELEALDSQLILMVEDALVLARNLVPEVPASSWFKSDAGRLSSELNSFSEMTEERNYLLGLGWESEFSWTGRSET